VAVEYIMIMISCHCYIQDFNLQVRWKQSFRKQYWFISFPLLKTRCFKYS